MNYPGVAIRSDLVELFVDEFLKTNVIKRSDVYEKKLGYHFRN